MATVHIARLLGPVGFARTVAIKRLHAQYARDPEFVSMFLDEARMCARIRHPNIIPTLDVVASQGELFLVMEYVQGESLAHLVKAATKRGQRVPWRIAASVMAGCLHGLHAAHEAKDERGLPLGLVHRDVSPQNILVGVDGMARVLDFGIAKAAGRIHTTREGAVKGKIGYMAPEQMSGDPLTRQADIYAAAVCTWEALTGVRLFDGESEAVVLARVLTDEVRPPSAIAQGLPPELDAVVMRGLSRNAAARFRTAREFAQALDKLGPAATGEVGDWVESMAGAELAARARKVAAVEEGAGTLTPVSEGPSSGQAQRTAASHGSVRPTAISEHRDPPRTPGPRRSGVVFAVAAVGVAVLSVGAWLLLFERGSTPAIPGEKATASAPSTAATILASASEPPPPVPSATAQPDAPVTEGTASASAAPRAAVSRPPQGSRTARPARSASPWDLGGRQ
jgi:serine/threonine-protein kinase